VDRAMEPALFASGAMDGEAQQTSSERHTPGSRALHGDRKPKPTPGRRHRRENGGTGAKAACPLGAGLCPATASRSRRRDGGAGAKAACP